jgi:hypothetical protein
MGARDGLVSLLIPTYNRAALVPDAVRSALAQDYPDVEVILLDDGSTDETPAVAAALAATNPRIVAHRHERVGQSSTVNRGLELARGEVSVVLSDDDMLAPGAVSRAVAALADHPDAVIAFGDHDLIDLDGRLIRRHRGSPTTLERILADHEHDMGVGTAFRTAAARRAGGWDPRFHHVPDLDFYLRMGLLGGFVYVPELFGWWRTHDGQITSHSTDPECAVQHVEVIERFLARPDLPASLAALAPRARASAHLVAAAVLHPALSGPGERFFVLDRHAAARDESGRRGTADDAFARLATIADERLQLIETLHRAAAERLEVIHVLDRAAKDRLATVERLEAALAAERAETARLRARLTGRTTRG